MVYCVVAGAVVIYRSLFIDLTPRLVLTEKFKGFSWSCSIRWMGLIRQLTSRYIYVCSVYIYTLYIYYDVYTMGSCRLEPLWTTKISSVYQMLDVHMHNYLIVLYLYTEITICLHKSLFSSQKRRS